MGFLTPMRRAAAWSALGMLVAAVLTGRGGGGGGGGQNTVVFGRSYSFANGGQFVVLSVDSVGRFTIVEKESSGSTANGAQGSLASDGRFFAQSADGTVQFSGQI